ncbi:MAG: pilus assembly protein [Clostridiales bacterium]|nr:pilus assembly protein [Clostridiales bacterium]
MRCKKKKTDRSRWKKFRQYAGNRNPEEYPSAAGKRDEKTLQAEKTDHTSPYSFAAGIRRVFLWIQEKTKRRPGSLTVEAAIAIPLFLLTVSSILGILDIYRVQSLVKASLHQSAQELGMYAYVGENGGNSPVGAVSSGVCAVYAKSRMPDLGKYVKVSTAGSFYRNGEINLIARVEYRLPVAPVPIPAIQLKNESRVKAWIGWKGGEGNEDENGQWEEMVYVSANESVYHTASSCTHINLAVHQGSMERVEDLRNVYGGKYHCCEKCGTPPSGAAVYYGEKGTRYHWDENCSGLKRTVRLVKKSEVAKLHQCERCKGRGQS